jgi:hypothetical protein
MNREQYQLGYQAGLKGHKQPKDSAADYLTGYQDGAADRRYNQRVSQHEKTFRGWQTLCNQTSFLGGEP